MVVWKRLGYPQRNQRTWWQIVATPYAELAQLTTHDRLREFAKTVPYAMLWRVYGVKNSGWSMHRSRDIPAGCRTNQHDLKAYARCFTLVSTIAEGWHKKCRYISRRSDGLTMLDWFTVHEATLSACIRESGYVRSHMGCGRVHQTQLLHVPQIFQRRKSDANKQDFEI